MLCISIFGHYIIVANSLYTFSSTPFLHDENFAGRCVSRAAFCYANKRTKPAAIFVIQNLYKLHPQLNSY